MEKACKDLHDIVMKHEEMIKELTLEISSLQQEIEIQNKYFQESIDSIVESIENCYFL